MTNSNPLSFCENRYTDCEYSAHGKSEIICRVNGKLCNSYALAQSSPRCTDLSMLEASIGLDLPNGKSEFLVIPEILKSKLLDFQSALRVQEDKKRQKNYTEIAKLAAHLFPKSQSPEQSSPK